MKLRTGLILFFSAIFALPVLANDPSMNNTNSNTGSGNTGQMNPGREQWTQRRIRVLKGRRKRAREQGHPGGDIRDGLGAVPDNPFFTGDEAALRRREAIKRQNDINTIELLMLKNERGELSPAGKHKLNQLLRHYTR